MTKKRLICLLILLICLAAALFMRQADPTRPGFMSLFGCGLYRATGLYCPGCGGMRMAYQLSHFNFLQAFRLNPFVFISLAVGAYYFVRWALSLFSPLPPARVRLWLLWLWLACMLVFTVLRNIPLYPFTLLRPA